VEEFYTYINMGFFDFLRGEDKKTGFERYNQIKAQVRAEHPDWSLKQIMMEAKRRYRK
jgi:hypothetical protein